MKTISGTSVLYGIFGVVIYQLFWLPLLAKVQVLYNSSFFFKCKVKSYSQWNIIKLIEEIQ